MLPKPTESSGSHILERCKKIRHRIRQHDGHPHFPGDVLRAQRRRVPVAGRVDGDAQFLRVQESSTGRTEKRRRSPVQSLSRHGHFSSL